MRVLYVSHSYPPAGRPLANVGGMQRVAVDLGNALAAHPRVELSTVCLRTSWRWTGVRTGPFLVSLLWRIPAIVRAERIEVVLFSSMVTAAVTPLLISRIHRAGAIAAAIPVGRDVTLPNPVYQRLVPRILAALDLVLPISRATAEECLGRGARPDRVAVVPCGIDLRQQPVRGGDRNGRHDLVRALEAIGFPVPEESVLLLSVGRHQERKGFHWFVDEVMPRLPSRFVYLLAGEGPMTPVIREHISRSPLEERVFLPGRASEDLLAKLYGGSDLFVMPNRRVAGDIEGFGVVMLEAGAAGLPVVAAELEGIRDVITPDRNGRLVPPGDAEAFVRAIQRYADPELRAFEGRRAAEHVRRYFGWESIVEMYLREFRLLSTPALASRGAGSHRTAAHDGFTPSE